jgi:ketosteroid isomerase-like protein
MKRNLLAVLLFSMLLASDVAHTAATQEPEPSRETLIALDKEWGDVVAKKDAARLRQILADDFIGIGDKGEKYTKADEIKQLENRTPANGRYGADDYDVRFLNRDIALMVHRGSFSGQEDGKNVFEEHRSLHVLVKRDGRWQVFASDATPIAQ